MDWHDETADGLPAPRDDEPSTLRQDILDELADHLACAFSRELTKNITPAEAVDNVKRRFGDPRAIARRLWFDAMKEKIVSQRVMVVLLVLLALVTICATGFAWVALRESQALTRAMQESNAALAEKMAAMAARSPNPAPPAQSTWVPVKFKLCLDEKGHPPAANYIVSLATENSTLRRTSGSGGEADFGTLPAGLYWFRIETPWNEQTLGNQLTVPPGQPLVRTVICPSGAEPETDVTVTLDDLDGLAGRDCLVVCSLERKPTRFVDGLPYSYLQGTRNLDVVFDGTGHFLGSFTGELQVGSHAAPWQYSEGSQVDVGTSVAPLESLLPSSDGNPKPVVKLRQTPYRLAKLEVLLASTVLQPTTVKPDGTLERGPRLNWADIRGRAGRTAGRFGRGTVNNLPLAWCTIPAPPPESAAASADVFHPRHDVRNEWKLTLPPALLAEARALLEANPAPVPAETAAETAADKERGMKTLDSLGIKKWTHRYGDVGRQIESLVPDSAAAKAGFKTGDRLVALNDWRIDDESDIGWIRRRSGSALMFRVQRYSGGGGMPMMVKIEVPVSLKKEPPSAAK